MLAKLRGAGDGDGVRNTAQLHRNALVRRSTQMTMLRTERLLLFQGSGIGAATVSEGCVGAGEEKNRNEPVKTVGEEET